jgi:hypothetical protein
MHFFGLEVNEEIRKSYEYLHVLDQSRFKPVSVEGLQWFYTNNLVDKITPAQYEELVEFVQTHPLSGSNDDFKTATWKPLDENVDSVYIWENRPSFEAVDHECVPVIKTEEPIGQVNNTLVFLTMTHYEELKIMILENREKINRLTNQIKQEQEVRERREAEDLGLEYKLET